MNTAIDLVDLMHTIWACKDNRTVWSRM